MRFKEYLIDEAKGMKAPNEIAASALSAAKGSYNKALERLVHRRFGKEGQEKQILQMAIDILKRERISR